MALGKHLHCFAMIIEDQTLHETAIDAKQYFEAATAPTRTVITILLFCLPTDSTRELENQQNYQCLDLNITDQKNPYSYLLIKQYVTS